MKMAIERLSTAVLYEGPETNLAPLSQPVDGFTYIAVIGYDTSHTKPSTSCFLATPASIKAGINICGTLLDSLTPYNSARCLLSIYEGGLLCRTVDGGVYQILTKVIGIK